MTQTENNRPADTLFDGSLKASIWANANNEGQVRYTVELSRSYKDANDQWQSSNSYSGSELLRIARLAEMAYTRIAELRRPT